MDHNGRALRRRFKSDDTERIKVKNEGICYGGEADGL